MKTIARLFRALFPSRPMWAATIACGDQLARVTFSAPDARRALLELEDVAEGGYVVDFTQI